MGPGLPGMTPVLLVNHGNHRSHKGLRSRTAMGGARGPGQPWAPIGGLAPRPMEGKKRLPLYDFHRSFRLSWDNTESLVRWSCYY